MESAEIFELISKADAGSISASEQEKLNEWKQASEANAIEFAELSALFKASADTDTSASDRSWERLKFAIESQSPKKTSNKTWLWLAASLMAVSMLAYFFYPISASEAMAYSSGSNEIKSIELPDGSKVQMNQLTKLKFEEKDGKRICSFDGEAYFEISKNPEKPFIIEGSHTDIQVLGTKFLFNDRSASDLALVKVTEGKVKFSDKKLNEKILVADEEAMYANESLIKKNKTTSFDIKKWQTKELDFNDAILAEVIPQIESMYAIQIHCSQKGILYCRFSGNFKNDRIETVMQVLASSLNLQLSNTQESYLLEGKACDE
ncbi:MAG: FecR family protein [Bacteroidia bacterium]